MSAPAGEGASGKGLPRWLVLAIAVKIVAIIAVVVGLMLWL